MHSPRVLCYYLQLKQKYNMVTVCDRTNVMYLLLPLSLPQKLNNHISLITAIRHTQMTHFFLQRQNR